MEVFTFGGNPSIDSSPEVTLSIMTSPAPILDLKTETSLGASLAYEMEILLAEQHATLINDPGQFEQWLVTTNPVTLYNWGVRTLHEKFKEYPSLESTTPPKFLTFLNTNVKHL